MRTLKTAPNVLVLKRKWAISLKNSRLCFLGWSGNFSGSLSPNISILLAFISTVCPLPNDEINCPSTLIAAPVVIRLRIFSGVLLKSTTICTLLLQLPSFKAINWLLLNVLTQPFTKTVISVCFDFNNSFYCYSCRLM